MTKGRLTVLYLLAFIFQLTVVNIIGIKNVGPNLILCLTVVITFVFNDDGNACFCNGRSDRHMLRIHSRVDRWLCLQRYSLSLRGGGVNTELYTARGDRAIATLVYNIIYWLYKITGDPMSMLYMLKFRFISFTI